MKKTRYFDSFAEYHDFYEENGHEINRVDVVAGPLWIVADAEIECKYWRTALRRFESALAEDENFDWIAGYHSDARTADDVDGRFFGDCDGYMLEQLSEGVWYVAARSAVKPVKTADDETETETPNETAGETAAEDNTTGGSTMYTLNDYIRDTADLPAAELRETIRNLRDAVAMLDHICADHILNEKTPAETVAAYVAALDASKWVQESAIDGREIAEIIIASLVNRSAWDGRISRASSEWARSVQDCMEEVLCDRLRIYTQMHMVHLDQIARAMMAYEPQETETGDETAEESSEDQSEEETGEDSETVGISLSVLRDALDSGEISQEEYRQACREMREDLDGMERVYNATRDRSVSESVAEIVRDYNDRFYGRYGFRGSMEGAADAVRDMVASLVNRSAWDGRLSRRVVAWAASREYAVSADLAVEMGIQTGIHLANLDQIARCLMDYTPEERTDDDRDRSEEKETAEETETDRDGETVAESLVLPTDSDRVRAICERIGERIAEYATMPVDSLDVCIADGNSKVGHIKNVSQPPAISCRGVCAECGGDCYDGRAVIQYPDTAAARGRNWSIYTRDPLAYFGQIIGTVRRMRKRFFRWHVGGEIVDGLYFRLMIATARLAPRVTFLCFTKRHRLIADELAAMGGRDALPDNLRLILSAWPGLPLYNPYDLPVSAPYAGDKPRSWYGCPGNCEDCAARNIGCWSLPSGAVVGFAYHGTAGDLFAERFAAWEDRPTGERPKRTASSKKGAATA